MYSFPPLKTVLDTFASYGLPPIILLAGYLPYNYISIVFKFVRQGTMYPQQYIVRCDGVSCEKVEVNPTGLGTSTRIY